MARCLLLQLFFDNAFKISTRKDTGRIYVTQNKSSSRVLLINSTIRDSCQCCFVYDCCGMTVFLGGRMPWLQFTKQKGSNWCNEEEYEIVSRKKRQISRKEEWQHFVDKKSSKQLVTKVATDGERWWLSVTQSVLDPPNTSMLVWWQSFEKHSF